METSQLRHCSSLGTERCVDAANPIALTLDERTLAALDRHIELHRQGRSRADVIAEILSVWAASPEHTAAPDEGLRPEELNASNDS